MILEKVRDIYINNMDEDAFRYLENRGITRESAKKYEIGLHSELVLTRTLSDAEIRSARMVSPNLFYDYWPKKENKEWPDRERRLVYPLYGYEFGAYKLKGFQARSIEKDSFLPHRQLPEVYYSIFNEKAIDDSRSTLIITEGQNDCIIMEQEGFNCIALLGVHKFREDDAEFFRTNGIKRAYILFDNDINGSGDKGARKTGEILTRAGIQAMIGHIPAIRGRKSTDINDLYLWDKKSFRRTIRKTIGSAKLFKIEKRRIPIRHSRNYKKINSIPISDIVDIGYDQRREIAVKCMLPGHVDSKASFRYNREKNVFYCFGCGQSGGPVQFVMAYKGLSRNEAIRLLEERIR